VLNLPDPCVVVLVGPGAAGKSTWAATHFPPSTVLGSDALRALVGAGEDDISASADAFAVLDDLLNRRLRRKLTTVIDTLGLDPATRQRYLATARANGMSCVAVAFDTPAAECRARNRARQAGRIPANVLTAQLKAWPRVRDGLPHEGFDQVLSPGPVRVVPAEFVGAPASAQRQREDPAGLRFGLHLGEFRFAKPTGVALREIAEAAENAGFDAIYVMDHFRQIPQIGRAFDDVPESFTTLAHLAAVTSRVRLGTLVAGVTYRNVAHLGKIVATLDVLSGGRAVCGLGLGWFEAEHLAYGWRFPPVPKRYELLEDALRLLPVLWGPGSPPFHGEVLNVPETMCYPRPLQAHVPVIVGGGGERRTLRLAAKYADAANVFGDLATVRRKAAVLAAHCRDADRAVALTHLSTTLIGRTDAEVAALVGRLKPRNRSAATYAASVHAGTVPDQIGRFRDLADAGVSEVMVRLPDLTDPAPLTALSDVIGAFR
jgi:F420-dependent oxidoreductase-like protein